MIVNQPVVVDVSVAAKWFVDEEHTTVSRDLLLQNAGSLLAPEFLVIELGNVFLKKVRNREVTERYARGALARISGQVELLATTHLRRQTFDIALRHNRSFYDALYVALALDEDCQLVTADERMYNALVGALPETMVWVGGLQAS